LQATSDFNKEMLGITDEDVERILDEFPED